MYGNLTKAREVWLFTDFLQSGLPVVRGATEQHNSTGNLSHIGRITFATDPTIDSP